MKTTIILSLVMLAVVSLSLGSATSTLPSSSSNREERRDTLRSIVDKYASDLKETLKGYGLSEKHQEELVAEFKEVIRNIPIPPLSPWDLMSPSKIYAYVQEVRAFLEDVYNRIKARANELLKEAKGELKRDINFSLTLPGGKILLNADFSGIEKYLREQFQALRLKREDQDRLLGQYEEFVKGLPKLRPLELLNPLKVVKFVEFVTVKVGEFVANVLHEAEQLVKGILVKEKRAIRLPGLADLVEHMKEHVENALESLTGLKKEQRKQLVEEFLDMLRDFPNVNGWHTLKPSQIGKYLKEVKEFADGITKTIVEKAKEMIENNKAAEETMSQEKRRRSLVDIGQRLPGMRDLVEHLQKRFEDALNSVTGLTQDQRQELVKDFMDGVRNFANDRKIDSLKPSQIKKYLEDLKEYSDEVINSVLGKARALAAGNNVKHEKRAIELPQFVKDFQNKLIQSFKSAVYAISGVTHEQQEELVQEFKDGLAKIPKPQFSFNPLKWVQYVAAVTRHNINLTKTLLSKAWGFVTAGKSDSDSDSDYSDKDRRALNIDAVLDELVLQFKNILSSISGLNEEETEALIQEFRDQIHTYPTMPFPDWFSPSKVIDYLKRLREFGLKLTSLFLDKAKAIVDHRLSSKGKRAVAVDYKITFPEVTDDETPNFDKLVAYVKNYVAQLGLTEDEQNLLIARVKVELNKYPKRPSGSGSFDPIQWAQYVMKRNTYIKNVVLKAMSAAEDYIAKKNANLNKS